MNKKYLPFLLAGITGVVVLVVVFSSKSGKSGGYDTIFPLPTTVEGFTKGTAEGQINFQTKLSIKDAENFYRIELNKMGLKERTLNTVVTDETFSMVFDGYKNGKAVVVQGVSLQGKTNLNIRFESL